MKYLEIESLSKLTNFLTGLEVGQRVLDGRVEAYSCKAAGDDKKLGKQLQKQYAAELATSPIAVPISPLGALADASTRKLLVNLISTLNASFPDYDFSTIKADDFARCSIKDMCATVQSALSDVSEQQGSEFTTTLWAAIDEVITLKECEVFSYIPDNDDDPFSSNSLWSFNYFMYSKASKKILYFACMARSKRAAALSSSAADVDLTDSDDSDADGDEDEGDDSRTPRASQADKDDDGFFDWDDIDM